MTKAEQILAHFKGQDRILVEEFKRVVGRIMNADPGRLSVLYSGQVTGTSEDEEERKQQTLKNEARLRRKALMQRVFSPEPYDVLTSAEIMPTLRERLIADTYQKRVALWRELVSEGTFRVVIMAPGAPASQGAMAELAAARKNENVTVVASEHRRRERTRRVGKGALQRKRN